MSDNLHPLFTREEWAALTDDDRARWAQMRRNYVEKVQREHDARKRLNDSLTVERFSHDH